MVIPYMRHDFFMDYSAVLVLAMIWLVSSILPALWFWGELKIAGLHKKYWRYGSFVLVLILGTYIGGKAFHYIGPWGTAWFDFRGFLDLSSVAGAVFYGNMFGALLFGYLYLKLIREKSVWRIADFLVPAFALEQFFSRLISCFFIGDDFGISSTLPWAIKFLGPGYHYLMGLTLHPVQLYLSLANLLIFIVLLELRNKEKWHGWLLLNYLWLYGVMRFIIEFFRDTTESSASALIGLTYSQIISVILVVVSLSILYWKKRKERSLT